MSRGAARCVVPRKGSGAGRGTGVARAGGRAAGRPRGGGPWGLRPSEVGPGLLMGVRAGCDPHEEPRDVRLRGGRVEGSSRPPGGPVTTLRPVGGIRAVRKLRGSKWSPYDHFEPRRSLTAQGPPGRDGPCGKTSLVVTRMPGTSHLPAPEGPRPGASSQSATHVVADCERASWRDPRGMRKTGGSVTFPASS